MSQTPHTLIGGIGLSLFLCAAGCISQKDLPEPEDSADTVPFPETGFGNEETGDTEIETGDTETGTPQPLPKEPPPADTYFSMAITENSNNHTGDHLLFLDFSNAKGVFDTVELGNKVIQAPFTYDDSRILDGDMSDWFEDNIPTTTVRASPKNNYPLSYSYDGVPTDILMAAAYSDTHIYLVVQWEDPGHTQSQYRKQWVWSGEGSQWRTQSIAPLEEGAPNSVVVNAQDELSGDEDEDRVLFMFPMVDSDTLFFADEGLGCAGYCHGNLMTWGDPTTEPVGSYAAMHSGEYTAKADVWTWLASRTAPLGMADDLSISDSADATKSGVSPDEGTAPYSPNESARGNPLYQHSDGFNQGPVLYVEDAIPLFDAPNHGDQIPHAILHQPDGSRADVQAVATFDDVSAIWTVEFQRLRDTGHEDDRPFLAGDSPLPPTSVHTAVGNPAQGQAQFLAQCATCHSPTGAGYTAPNVWIAPSIQRTSNGLIQFALQHVTEMSALEVTEEERVHIASWLQTQFSPAP